MSGVVTLRGYAVANGLSEVTLDVGAGLSPTEWTSLRRDARITVTGPLGTWDTTAFDNGVHTIRLRVLDQAGGLSQTSIAVTVRNVDADDE